MKLTKNIALVLVTTPDLKTARTLTRAALTARLIACANLVPNVESHYRWQSKLERSGEVLLVLKTTSMRLAKLEKLIIGQHPYDTPEILIITPRGGNERYLAWLENSCATAE